MTTIMYVGLFGIFGPAFGVAGFVLLVRYAPAEIIGKARVSIPRLILGRGN